MAQKWSILLCISLTLCPYLTWKKYAKENLGWQNVVIWSICVGSLGVHTHTHSLMCAYVMCFHKCNKTNLPTWIKNKDASIENLDACSYCSIFVSKIWVFIKHVLSLRPCSRQWRAPLHKSNNIWLIIWEINSLKTLCN